MKKGTCRSYTVYWYNPTYAKTGYVHYRTYSEERAFELFYKNYSKNYIVLNIHD